MIQSRYLRPHHEKRYNHPLFKNGALQNQLKDEGYVIVDLIDELSIQALKKGYKEIASLVNNDFGPLFWPSGRSESISIRNLAKDSIDAVLPKLLKKVLIENTYDLIGGTYLIKPISPESNLSPHQDSSHVLEDKRFSVYCWAPLEDVDEHNGCLYILPKSHKINLKQRSLNVPWAFKNHSEFLTEFMVPLPLKSGQVVFFDAGLIHSSSPNLSKEIRVAVNYYIHPKNQAFCHFYYNSNLDKVEVFSVTPDFYYNEDFERRPSDKYILIDTQEPTHLDLKLNEVKSAIHLIAGNYLKSTYFRILYSLGL